MLKAVIVAQKGSVKEELMQEVERKLEGRVAFEWIPLVRDLIGEIKKKAPDILLTVDLSGFEHATLTDNIAYNLLDCKQIHLLLNENLPNKRYLEKPLSIAMFFGCVGAEYHKNLKRTYPHIPWLKEMVSWSMDEAPDAVKRNAKLIVNLLEAVMCECRLV